MLPKGEVENKVGCCQLGLHDLSVLLGQIRLQVWGSSSDDRVVVVAEWKAD